MSAEMLVAITGFLVGAAGIFLNYRGMRDQRRQQDAATMAMKDKSRLDETQQALDAAVRRAELAEGGEVRKQARIDVLDQHVDRLQQEVDEAHLYRRQRLSAQAAEFRERESELIDTIATLKSIVVSEVAHAAAETVLHQPRPIRPAAEPPLDGEDF